MAKQDTVDVFRKRLAGVIESKGVSRARFAAAAGLDRSTLSLLLSEANSRLPRAETIAHIANRHGVSVDWLLGLSEEESVKADIVSSPDVFPNADDPGNEQLRRWLEDARGAKIRYVPSSLPDQLKTEAVIAHECGRHEVEAREAMADIMRQRIAHARSGASEIEVCSSLQSVEHFARGEGIWKKFPVRERRRQLERMVALIDELYPAYRWFMFDGRERFSSPYTIFGQKRAAVYMGAMYFVFTSTAHIRELTAHFGDLIRNARIQPNAAAAHVRKLLKEAA